MKYIFIITSFWIIGVTGITIGQQAADFFPSEAGAVWVYDVEITVNDTTEVDFQRIDTLVGINDVHAGERQIDVLSQPFGPLLFTLRADSIFASVRLPEIPLPNEAPDMFFGILNGLQFADVLLFRTEAEIGVPEELAEQRVRVPTPQPLRDAVEQNGGLVFITLGDSLDLIASVSVTRMNAASVDLPAGIFQAQRFRQTISIDAELQVRTQSPLGSRTDLFRFPVVTNLNQFTWLAPGTGIVKQQNDSTALTIDTRLLPEAFQNLPQVQIPGITTSLRTFSPDGSTSAPPITKIENNQTAQFAKLQQNFPNPFNPVTTIPFELSEPSLVQIQIFSSDGRLVADFAESSYPMGSHQKQFHAGNLSSGVYVYRLTAQSLLSGTMVTFSRSLTLVK